ncbi:MAG: hypothetical protein A2X48_20755 [Lentisphaerae bacterium GWF2_49_21]|nr:MAG: hypothetical protein A2X48_20755 [Lentisphaerae bacterium GWF2_49_21]
MRKRQEMIREDKLKFVLQQEGSSFVGGLLEFTVPSSCGPGIFDFSVRIRWECPEAEKSKG